MAAKCARGALLASLFAARKDDCDSDVAEVGVAWRQVVVQRKARSPIRSGQVCRPPRKCPPHNWTLSRFTDFSMKLTVAGRLGAARPRLAVRNRVNHAFRIMRSSTTREAGVATCNATIVNPPVGARSACARPTLVKKKQATKRVVRDRATGRLRHWPKSRTTKREKRLICSTFSSSTVLQPGPLNRLINAWKADNFLVAPDISPIC